ncbi:hypothetical protein JY651_37775 [Pyxidicoccus parkwayensis]|uniref:Dickkopf N-terminal cysteine-rich domain-containing protein n=1 Tax=Pyxidicoccus parkwayensis TaxID=2813578 RepID=A0ABX7NU73_9BACT|nr:hypothetical protein [Pyxidicoccus parkwaysis]QSQ20929.1 hypothetical protein JY651_37775 [Pyxidicoccus parkwaysis]
MRGWRAVLAVMWVGLAACDGTKVTDMPSQEEPVERADFNAKAAEALCERYARCGLIDDQERCREQQLSYGLINQVGLGSRYDEALEAGRIQYDAARAGQCVQALRDGSCDEAPVSLPMQNRGIEYDSRCRILWGQVADGAACQWSTECREGAYCDATVSSCGGVCRRGTPQPPVTPFDACPHDTVLIAAQCLEPGGEGAPCGTENGRPAGVCGQGLWCDAHGLTRGTCKPVSTEGQACDDYEGPWCGWSLFCREGRCQKPKAKGGACTAPGTGRFGTLECRDELFCDGDEGQPGTCRPRLAVGASCRNAYECGDGMNCLGAKPRDGVRGTCEPAPREGESCTEQLCAPGLACSSTTHTCVTIVRLGEPCEDDDACYFVGRCVDGTCKPVGAQSCH